MKKHDKKAVADEAGMIDVWIKPEEILALKVKLGLPWEQLKTIAR